ARRCGLAPLRGAGVLTHVTGGLAARRPPATIWQAFGLHSAQLTLDEPPRDAARFLDSGTSVPWTVLP
ncbi:MAG: hypothetical protein ABSH34_35970, partial [Verrucomicrobiota bacterium]